MWSRSGQGLREMWPRSGHSMRNRCAQCVCPTREPRSGSAIAGFVSPHPFHGTDLASMDGPPRRQSAAPARMTRIGRVGRVRREISTLASVVGGSASRAWLLRRDLAPHVGRRPRCAVRARVASALVALLSRQRPTAVGRPSAAASLAVLGGGRPVGANHASKRVRLRRPRFFVA